MASGSAWLLIKRPKKTTNWRNWRTRQRTSLPILANGVVAPLRNALSLNISTGVKKYISTALSYQLIHFTLTEFPMKNYFSDLRCWWGYHRLRRRRSFYFESCVAIDSSRERGGLSVVPQFQQRGNNVAGVDVGVTAGNGSSHGTFLGELDVSSFGGDLSFRAAELPLHRLTRDEYFGQRLPTFGTLYLDTTGVTTGTYTMALDSEVAIDAGFNNVPVSLPSATIQLRLPRLLFPNRLRSSLRVPLVSPPCSIGVVDVPPK